MVTIDSYQKERLEEFSRLRNLPSSSKSPWVETMEPDNIWNCEYLSKLKGVGTQEEKMNELKICMIYDLTDHVFSYGLPKVQIFGLVAIYENALKALPVKQTALVKYHRKSKNHYFSRYREIWVEKLKNFYFMSKSCCISELIRFMVKEGEKRMKGSVHGDDFYSAR